MKRTAIKRFIIPIFILSFSYLNAQDWLPLQVGNQWQYLSSTQDDFPGHQYYSIYFSSVDFDTLIGGDTYYNLYSLLRYDSSSQKLFIWCDSVENLHIDFTLPVDSIVILSTLECYSDEIRIIAAYNSFNDSSIYCKGINWFMPGLLERYEYWYFARGLGFFSLTEYGQANGGHSWETHDKLIQANINGVNYSESYYPEIIIDPDTTISDSVFQLTFQVHHQYNRVFPDTIYYTNLNFIDTVKMHSYYSNGTNIIDNPIVYAYSTNGTENWIISTIINTELMLNDYTFNYQIEAIDKGLVPHKSFFPEIGYFEVKLDTTTGIDIINDGSFSFEIAQNYPNPFNNSTKIKYSIPSYSSPEGRTRVVIKVYDILGSEVSEIVDQEQSPGIYTVNFDASQLSSGVYFYQLRANNIILTKKMIYLR